MKICWQTVAGCVCFCISLYLDFILCVCVCVRGLLDSPQRLCPGDARAQLRFDVAGSRPVPAGSDRSSSPVGEDLVWPVQRLPGLAGNTDATGSERCSSALSLSCQIWLEDNLLTRSVIRGGREGSKPPLLLCRHIRIRNGRRQIHRKSVC